MKCTHGATVGQLDADALFYLRAPRHRPGRGPRHAAYAFAAEVIGRMTLEPVRELLDRLMHEQLPGVAGQKSPK